ncbi:MAG: hypothetical protein EBR81_12045 [Proteobacteria bacterium]|nr:hypothetical protein [Pseudomonadota bacterium]
MSCTIESLLHHPLTVSFGSITPVLECKCRVEVPGLNEFTLEQKPVMETSPNVRFNAELMCNLASTWLQRRRIRVQCSLLGLVEPDRRKVWVVDIVGELDDKAVLICVYVSPKRRGQARERMRDYAQKLRKEVLKDVYRLDCQVCLLNVYGAGRLEGELLIDNE